MLAFDLLKSPSLRTRVPDLFNASRSTSRQLVATGGRDLQGFEVFLAQLGVTDVIVGEISGNIDIESLREAAYRCSCRHPGLRAAIAWPNGRNERPRFEFLPPNRAKVTFRLVEADGGIAETQLDGRPLWERIVESEAAHEFHVAEGYMFRVTWVPSEAGGHVIISAHHAVVDGVSLMRLLHELLDAYTSIDRPLIGSAARRTTEETTLPPTKAVLARVRSGATDRVLAAFARMYLLHQQSNFARDNPFRISGALDGDVRPGTHCWFHIGNADSWRRVRSRCRKHGVTVGGAFAAAAQFASLRFIQEQTGEVETALRAINFPMSMDYSLRQLIPGGCMTQPHIGLFTGVAEIGVRVPPNISFWQLAKKLMQRSQKQYRQGTPLLFQRALDGFLDLDQVAARHRISYAANAGVGSGVNLSNVGQFPYASEYQSVRLEHIYGCNGAMRGGPMLTFWLRSVNGHFCYNAVSASPAITNNDADRLFASAAELMESCGTLGVSHLNLSDYVHL